MAFNPIRTLMKARRAELGRMTQAEAAKLAGCDRSTWNRWEREGFLPPEECFPDIARALELRIEDLQREMVAQWQGVLGEVGTTMKLEGDDPKIPLSGYKLRNPVLQQIERLLEGDFSSIEDRNLQLYLSEWRGVLRSQLINADANIHGLAATAKIFRSFVISLLGLPKSIFRDPKRRARVSRPKK